jgi:hypothetical protein
LNEFDEKRKEKCIGKNSEAIYDILSSILNREEIIASQESFSVTNIKTMLRMEKLLNEMYIDEFLLLDSYPDEHSSSKHTSIIHVKNRENLFNTIHTVLTNIIGEGYVLTYEKLIYPNCLSFKSDKQHLYLMNYDDGVINVL